MNLFGNLLNRAKETLGKYAGDKTFLKAACAAAALVIAADGVVEDSEVTSAMNGLTSNTILKGSYKASEIEDELSLALNQSKSRAGKVVLNRELEAITAKPREMREDIFLIAADIGDVDKETGSVHGIGAAEKKALEQIAKALGLDMNKLLGA